MASSIQYWLHSHWLIGYIIRISLSRDPVWDSKGLDDDIRGPPLKLGGEIKKFLWSQSYWISGQAEMVS